VYHSQQEIGRQQQQQQYDEVMTGSEGHPVYVWCESIGCSGQPPSTEPLALHHQLAVMTDAVRCLVLTTINNITFARCFPPTYTAGDSFARCI